MPPSCRLPRGPLHFGFSSVSWGSMTRSVKSPDLESRLSVLMSLAADDRDGQPPPPRLRHARGAGALGPLNIRNLRTSRGTSRLLRVLMTNACSFNCHYCPMRRDRELPRTLLKPEELVRVFLGALSRNW